MTFEVEINGRMRAVTVEPLGNQLFRVTVDGVLQQVTITRTDLGLSLLFGDGRVVDAAVTPQPGDEWLVQLPHVAVTATVDGRRHAHGRPAGVVVPGEQRVVAPMPGRVLRVLVAAGDQVVERQGLVVVEAMKMENEIGAPKAGRVKEVGVAEGVSIEAGGLLVVIE